VIRATAEDFHNISGNFQPKGHQIDRIGEAAGISFLTENCGTRTETVDGNTVYVGFAQAKKRLPDGTWRTSSICEYEFNPVKRAEEDILKNTVKYGNVKEQKLLLLSYQKFGRQRADTGARLRVIRELTGMPISFKPQEIAKAMIFSRVSVNTDALLADPEMRAAAIRIATGASEQLYGPSKEQKYITEGEKAQTANYEVKNGVPAGEPEKKEVEVPWETDQKQQETEEEIKNRGMVEELRAGRDKLDKVLPPDAKSMIDDILKKEKPNPASVSAMIDKLNAWEARYLERKGARG
jgi:hypothetical protein